ncbi:MAG: hypothetical protein AAGI91_00890 [Bacteroidota bacterium]
MGKAALLIAFGASLFIAQGMLSQKESEHQTTKTQANFEESVIAREIARSGFNIAMGIMREYGNDLHEGIAAVNQHGGGKYLEGQHQGGTFRARAELANGHTVRITSRGYFGGEFMDLNGAGPGMCAEPDEFSGEYYTGGCHKMADDSPLYEYEPPSGDPLTAKLECSKLETEFIQSEAGYCSAIYLERTLPDSTVVNPEPEIPEMLFIPGKNRDRTTLTIDKYLTGGTQMNFFIAVDKNCSTRPTGNPPVESMPIFDGDMDNPAPYDHLHYALEENANSLGDMIESPWAFTEMHPSGVNNTGPDDVQRWRIAFEDLRYPQWDNPDSDNPERSLQALKRLGYDGEGWPTEDSWGYRTLEDHYRSSTGGNSWTGFRPDFSDQVIEVKLVEEDDLSLCGIETEDDEGGAGEGEDDDGEGEDEEDEGEDEGEATAGGEEDEGSEEAAECACPRDRPNKTVAVSRAKKNGSRRIVCLKPDRVNWYLNNHDAYEVCRGS